jgi:hypothetical protein
MRTIVWTILAAAAAWGQPPVSRLDCVDVRYHVNNLVTYCQLRETTLPAASTLLARISGSGSISVRPWDGADILPRAQVLAAAESSGAAQAVASEVAIDAFDGSVRASGPKGDARRPWAANLEIYVPRETNLTLDTVNGDIAVENLQGRLSLTVTNGAISVKGGAGPIAFRSVNGNVSLEGVAGDIDGRGTNGVIRIEVGEWRRRSGRAARLFGARRAEFGAGQRRHQARFRRLDGLRNR